MEVGLITPQDEGGGNLLAALCWSYYSEMKAWPGRI